MKLKLLFTLVLSLLFSFTYAQNHFRKLVGTGFSGEARSFCTSTDGNYVVACAGSLIKVDTSGYVVWVKKYLTPAMYNQSKVIRQMNGGYLVIYDIKFGGVGGNDIMVFNTDSAGQIEWIKIYGSNGYDVPSDVLEMSNGDFVICGQSNAFTAGDKDVLMMRISKFGEQVWQRTYGTSSDEDAAEKLIATASGNIVVAGSISNQLSLVKTNSFGEFIWSKAYGYGALYDLIENPANGDLFACGKMVPDISKSGQNLFVMNTDSSGNVKWAKIIGNNANECAYSLSANSDYSQIYLAGQELADTSSKGNAIAMSIQGSDGAISWSKSYGTAMNEVFYDNLLLNDNTLVNVGFSDYSDTTYHNLYIVKTTADGVSGCNDASFVPAHDSLLSLVAYDMPLVLDSGELTVITKCYPPSWIAHGELTLCSNSGIEDDEENQTPYLYPNPVTGESHIVIVAGTYKSYEVFDVAGQCLKASVIGNQTNNIAVKASEYAAGIYLLKLFRENGSSASIKFVVQ
ncbi:MAG: T9SS type A sorting domain-containing protein [Bacteroidota bacterium]